MDTDSGNTFLTILLFGRAITTKPIFSFNTNKFCDNSYRQRGKSQKISARELYSQKDQASPSPAFQDNSALSVMLGDYENIRRKLLAYAIGLISGCGWNFIFIQRPNKLNL